MNPSALFIHRPVMTTLVTLALFVFGLGAYLGLPVSDLPNADFPVITVSASYPGAAPELMAANVATPMEKQFTQISGLNTMLSTSQQGTTSVVLTFAMDKDINAAATDVQAALSRAASLLPPNMPTPPSYTKTNPADKPTLFIVLTSETMTQGELYDYANTIVAQPINMVEGVSTVLVNASRSAIRVYFDPRALATRGIGINDAIGAITANSSNKPLGELDGPNKTLVLEGNNQLLKPEQYEESIIFQGKGRPVRLKEVGRAFSGLQYKDFHMGLSMDGKKPASSAVALAVVKAPGSNEVAMAQRVRKMLPEMRNSLPGSIEMTLVFDRSQQIVESINDVKMTLLQAFFLVIAVIFLFLGRVTETIVPAVSIPVTFVLTFILMKLCGFSLNNLTLMALTLGVGFVVDDAIVVLEHTVAVMEEEGLTPFPAAVKAAGEIGFTVLSMTLSLSAVFIPLVFMEGMIGRIFREFSLTIVLAILASGLVSLTLTPMMCARMLRSRDRLKPSRLEATLSGTIRRIISLYRASLRWVLHRPVISLLGWILCLVGTVVCFKALPKTFLPVGDSGFISGVLLMPQGSSPQALNRYADEVNAAVREDPSVANLTTVGGTGSLLTNRGLVFIHLKPEGKRPPIQQMLLNLERRIQKIPEGRVILRAQPVLQLPTLGGIDTDGDYVYALKGLNQDEVNAAAREMTARMKKLTSIKDVKSNMESETPRLTFNIHRDRASMLGLKASDVEQALNLAFSNAEVSTIQTSVDQYYIISGFLDEYRAREPDLSLIYLRSPATGAMIPLGEVAEATWGVGPAVLFHQQQFPSVSIAFNLPAGAPIGQATSDIGKIAREVLPPGISGEFQGDAASFQATLRNLVFLAAVAVFVMYLILGILYENYIHPFTVLSTLPVACFGGLLSLLVCRSDLSLYAFIGIFMLMGIVKKNGIMMVDFAIELEKKGQSTFDAIEQACAERFRPITMTGLAAIMGAVPVAMGWGADGASRQPLGICVVGGLIFSQVITLYITPVLYLLFDKLRSRKAASPEVAAPLQPQGISQG